MAIQTVLASYPAPVMPLIANNCISNLNVTPALAATSISAGDKDVCQPQSSITVKPVVSPQNELIASNHCFVFLTEKSQLLVNNLLMIFTICLKLHLKNILTLKFSELKRCHQSMVD